MEDFDEDEEIIQAPVEQAEKKVDLGIDDIFGSSAPTTQVDQPEQANSQATNFDDIFGNSTPIDSVTPSSTAVDDIFGQPTVDLTSQPVSQPQTVSQPTDDIFGSSVASSEPQEESMVKAFNNKDITVYYRANRQSVPITATIFVSSESENPITDLKITLLVNKKKVNLNITKTTGNSLEPKQSFGVKKEIELTNNFPENPIAMQIKYSYQCGFNREEDKFTIREF